MNFRQLEYIIQVDRFRNFNRAAIACDVAQSTLSKEIQRLEQEFEMIIFDRSRNPVVPTLKGIDIIKKAKEIRFHQKEFIHISLNRKNEISGYLNLAIAEILSPYLTPIFIKHISKKYPKLEIKILELSDRRIEDFLISEDVDAAVMISPSLTHNYFEQHLYEEELCLYSTELKSEVNQVSLSEINFKDILLHEDLKNIIYSQIHDSAPQTSAILNNKIKYLKGNLETLKNIINTNGGTMFIPKSATIYFNKTQKSKVYTIKEESLKLNVSLISARGFEKKRVIKKLVTELTCLMNNSL